MWLAITALAVGASELLVGIGAWMAGRGRAALGLAPGSTVRLWCACRTPKWDSRLGTLAGVRGAVLLATAVTLLFAAVQPAETKRAGHEAKRCGILAKGSADYRIEARKLTCRFAKKWSRAYLNRRGVPGGVDCTHTRDDSFSHRFNRLGAYTYFCRVHPDQIRAASRWSRCLGGCRDGGALRATSTTTPTTRPVPPSRASASRSALHPGATSRSQGNHESRPAGAESQK